MYNCEAFSHDLKHLMGRNAAVEAYSVFRCQIGEDLGAVLRGINVDKIGFSLDGESLECSSDCNDLLVSLIPQISE